MGEWYCVKLHRTEGPAIEYVSGDKYWYQDGNLHRTDGPAVEYAIGNKFWLQNGKLHREGGPAVKAQEWWLYGKKISEKAFNARTYPCKNNVVEIDGKKYRLVSV